MLAQFLIAGLLLLQAATNPPVAKPSITAPSAVRVTTPIPLPCSR
jgi:hypothetical protein